MVDLPIDKLQKLIPLLGSDVDGEVTATVAAIRRVLAKAGADLHDLAKAVANDNVRPSASYYSHAYYRAPEPEPKPKPKPDYIDVVEWCLSAGAKWLSDKETEFLESLTSKRFPSLTPRQESWLTDINRKIKRHVARATAA